MTTSLLARCAHCQKPIETEEDIVVCPRCHQTHHQDCWTAHGGCQTPWCNTTAGPSPDTTRTSTMTHEHPAAKRYLPWAIGGMIVLGLLASATLAVSMGAPLKTVLTISVIVAALTFDYVNGMHDAGNAIATVISTRGKRP